MSGMHDENSPSQLEKRMACPGSRAAEAELPEETSDDAARGTRLHQVVADCLRARTETARLPLLATVLRDDLEQVEACLDFADAMELDARHCTELPAGTKPLRLVEYRVDLSGIGIHKGGTIDFALVIPGVEAWLVDWKFGARVARWPVNNPQLQAYAWGLRQAFGVPVVNAGICQPAVADGSPEARWTSEQLHEIGERIAQAVAKTYAPDSPQVPGAHCTWCRARATCRARAEVAGTVAVLRDPVAVMRATDPADRASLWERLNLAIEVLRKASDAIEAEALAGGLDIPGYGPQPGRKQRLWTDATAAEAALRHLAVGKGIDPDTVAPRSLVSPAEAERLIGNGKAVTNALAGLIEARPGAMRLAKGGRE